MPKIVLPKPRATIYLGIDPGQSGGGLVALSSSQEVLALLPMKELTEKDMADWFVHWSSLREEQGTRIKGAIERVHSMPSQSAQSGFSFGGNYLSCRMAMMVLDIPFINPTPEGWMKALSIPAGTNVPRTANAAAKKKAQKEKLRAWAQQMFPSLTIWRKSKSKGEQLAICDALLIAEYARRIDVGSPS